MTPFERRHEERPMRRFGHLLITLNQPDLIDTALDKLIAADFAITESAAGLIVVALKREAVAAGVTYDEYNDVQMAEWYRILLFSQVLPLYRDAHTPGEFELWLPGLMAAVLPPPSVSRHDIDICVRQGDNASDCCEHGKCPVKIVAQSADDSTYFADFQAYDYIVDPDQAAAKTRILIAEIRRLGIVSEGAEYFMSSCFNRRYQQAFPELAKSTLRTSEKPV